MLPRMETSGDALKQARELMGLTQAELGRILDIPQATISRWESGRHKIEHARVLWYALQALVHAHVVTQARDGVEPADLMKDTSDG